MRIIFSSQLKCAEAFVAGKQNIGVTKTWGDQVTCGFEDDMFFSFGKHMPLGRIDRDNKVLHTTPLFWGGVPEGHLRKLEKAARNAGYTVQRDLQHNV